MAGSGRRVFQPGEVLTASNTMNYLMDQAVQVYAGTAARGSAIGTAVSEGMVSYLKDTNDLQVYTDAWKSVGPSGKIAQIVYGSTSSYVTNTTSSFVDGNLTATITPTSASSKILILINQFYGISSGSQIYNAIEFKTLRNGTQIALHPGNGYTETTNYRWGFFMSQTILDEPSTTSALTYKIQFRNQQSSSSATTQPGGGQSTITLIEVSQ